MSARRASPSISLSLGRTAGGLDAVTKVTAGEIAPFWGECHATPDPDLIPTVWIFRCSKANIEMAYVSRRGPCRSVCNFGVSTSALGQLAKAAKSSLLQTFQIGCP